MAGAPFAVLFWTAGDEAWNTGLRLTSPPGTFPIEAHQRGLANHIAYTATADAVYHLLQALAA